MSLYPTYGILHRIFDIRIITIAGDESILSSGTVFAIEVDSRQYLITARHIAQNIASNTQVQLWHNGSWNSIPIRIVGHGGGNVDVSVLASTIPLVPVEYQQHQHSPVLDLGGIILGQKTMFLGFPSGYDPSTAYLLSTGFPMPLVKYAHLSAISTYDYPIWLDGHNNEGFSGSPLCFIDNDTNKMHIAGVISAYQHIPKPVFSLDGRETGLYHLENMGLGLAWDIRHCLDIMHQNPIGLQMPTQ